MKKLIALIPILYLSKQYKAGEEIPAHDKTMVEAWTKAKSAIWKEAEEKKAVKGKEKTAPAGLSGTATNAETQENLVGRVPKTRGRTKK